MVMGNLGFAGHPVDDEFHGTLAVIDCHLWDQVGCFQCVSGECLQGIL